MCGVLAIYCAQSMVEPHARIRAMANALAHRGPDASGTFVSHDDRVALGHCRLSIVNIAPDASQPMRRGELAVVFNGEIYNHREIRQELERAGHSFRTRNSDTEVILVAYEAWGWTAMLTRIRGMFAIVLWDGTRKRFHAARDRLGIKPLYYTRVKAGLAMASEIKGLIAHPDVRAEMDSHACADILNVLATPAPYTLFRGVYKLAPGEAVEIDAGDALRLYSWWTIPPDGPSPIADPEEAANRVEAALRDSVQLRLADEVRSCIFLSGGIDSSLLLAMAAELGPAPDSFTASFHGDPLDESDTARQIAESFGSSHKCLDVHETEVVPQLRALTEEMDEPVADWACLPLRILAAQARRSGYKVALVGEGADELFAGYPGWRDFIWSTGRSRYPGSRALAKSLRGCALALPISRFGAIGGLDVIASDLSGFGRFRSGAEGLRWTQMEALLAPQFRASLAEPTCEAGALRPSIRQDVLDARLAAMGGGPVVASLSPEKRFIRMRRRDLSFRLPELLLMRVDKITMAHSLEARVPFLDHVVVETAIGCAPELMLDPASTKPLLKSVARRYLDDEVVNRPKIGLGAPMSKWLRGSTGREIWSLIEDELHSQGSPFIPAHVRRLFDRHRSGARDYAAQLWPVFNILLWRMRWLPA